MPGHIKLGKAGEPDPDPLPYLVVTLEMKRADMLLPYDPKKSYFCYFHFLMIFTMPMIPGSILPLSHVFDYAQYT